MFIVYLCNDKSQTLSNSNTTPDKVSKKSFLCQTLPNVGKKVVNAVAAAQEGRGATDLLKIKKAGSSDPR